MVFNIYPQICIYIISFKWINEGANSCYNKNAFSKLYFLICVILFYQFPDPTTSCEVTQ